MTAEPRLEIPNRDQLVYLLTEAAEIEHGLMCCYLYAAFSLRRGAADGLQGPEIEAVERWRKAIVGVAVEEMLHLALVSNMLAAVGSPPHFERQNFPVAPGYHPAGVVVSLAPFDRATLDHFIFLERPEGLDLPDGAGFEPPVHYARDMRGAARLVSSAQDYLTVGHLYRGIRQGFEDLTARMGSPRLFVGEPAAQVDATMLELPGFRAVTDLASASAAIDTIVEQGEGSPAHHERSHYQRFLSIRDELEALSKRRPDFSPALPVARNPVMRPPPDPRNKVHIAVPASSAVVDVGNAIYALALRCLSLAFGESDDTVAERSALLDVSIGLMGLLSPVASLLCHLPASEAHPGVNAGLTFTMQRSTVGFAQPRVAWPILVERCQEIAARCASLGETVDPTLTTVGRALAAMADKLHAA